MHINPMIRFDKVKVWYYKFQFRKGLFDFSSPIDVNGPCPGKIVVLSSIKNNLFLILLIKVSKSPPGRSVLPIEFLKITSPEKTKFMVFEIKCNVAR